MEDNISTTSQDQNLQTQGPTTSPPQSTSSKRIFIVIGIITLFLLLSLGSGVYYLANKKGNSGITDKTIQKSPTSHPILTSDPLANWKTYTNNQCGFTVNYPEESNKNTLFITQEKGGLNISNVQPPIPTDTIPKNIAISVLSDSKGLNPKAYVDRILNEKTQQKSGSKELTSLMEDPEAMANIKRETIQVGGKSSEKVIGLPSENGRIEVFIPCQDQLLYAILDPYHLPPLPEEKEWELLFNQVLSTAKFTE